ncbi:chitinase [Metarhizium acridum CQMa 102]|uniref:Chitinase n=1 Tax=Metarhizium acridum (strain CQMa 102) TaxID=655827 RepID=E9ECH6_METAQ|nr:chitinase [Metarhizium acridum CQMa 102]EFY86353.1 chitinase [Metarhizium acridum CQMa 102]
MRVPRDMAIAFTLVLIINAVHAALNLDGRQATEPVGHDDPSPIGDIDAPKKGHDLFGSSLDTATACFSQGKPTKGILSVASTMDIKGAGDGRQAADLSRVMGNYFQEKDNCDESFILGYHHKTAAGIYIGSGLGKQTAESSLNAMADRLQSNS